jgi:hypothetical protein
MPWSEEYEVKEKEELPKIYQFKQGANELILNLKEEPRQIATKFGDRRVVKGKTLDGEEISVFIPVFSGPTSFFGQLLKIAKEFGEKEHKVTIFVVGEGKARRYTLLHDQKRCGCKK